MPGGGQQKHCPIKGEEGHTEVYEQISGDNTEQYGIGAQQPSGSLPVPRMMARHMPLFLWGCYRISRKARFSTK